MKLVILAVCTFIASTATYLFHNFSHAPAKCLIPKGFSGDIYIVYDQPHGAGEEYDGNSRIYRIPANGVLFTKFSIEDYTADQEYYCMAEGGKTKKMTQVSTGDFNEAWSFYKNPHEPSRDSVVIIDGGIIWSKISASSVYDYQHAFVGSYNKFKSYKGFSLSDIDSLQKNCCNILR